MPVILLNINKGSDTMIDYTKDVLFIQDYCFNTQIVEYDIQSAGLSILTHSGVLSEDKIHELENMTKSSRVVSIGMMIRDNPEYQKIISNGLIHARKHFIESNHLSESDIICIKKDAIFTTKKCNTLLFDGIQFRAKNKWRSYLKLGKIEFFYLDKLKYQILGLGTVATDYHKNGWIKTIIDIIDRISNGDKSVRHTVMQLISQYKSEKLPAAYYQSFKSDPTQRDDLYNYQQIIIPLMQVLSQVI